MKAWEKHLVDQYLLANDILENLYYQQHGYKSAFYYAFNPQLGFLQSDGSYNAQLKLLSLLADKGILEYSIKTPEQYVTDAFFSRNVEPSKQHKKLIHLTIKPNTFNEVYAELLKYKPAEPEQPRLENDLVLQLRKVDNRLLVRIDSNDYLLKEFRAGMPPDEIFGWLVNRSPNSKVTRTVLETDAGIKFTRQLDHIVDKTLTPMARKLFVRSKSPNSVLLNTEVVAKRQDVELLLAEIG
ncbi:MAG: hypothetical protein AAB971_00390 [Patescibacteria group bacterium]